jgi:hypothetical protein
VLYSVDTQQLDHCVCTTSAQQTSSRRVSWWKHPFTPPTTKSGYCLPSFSIFFDLFQFSSIPSGYKTCHQRAASRPSEHATPMRSCRTASQKQAQHSACKIPCRRPRWQCHRQSLLRGSWTTTHAELLFGSACTLPVSMSHPATAKCCGTIMQ